MAGYIQMISGDRVHFPTPVGQANTLPIGNIISISVELWTGNQG